MVFQPELSLVVESPDGRAPLAFVVRHVVCAGYTSRDRSDAERHIQELGSVGIARPKEGPVFFAGPPAGRVSRAGLSSATLFPPRSSFARRCSLRPCGVWPTSRDTGTSSSCG